MNDKMDQVLTEVFVSSFQSARKYCWAAIMEVGWTDGRLQCVANMAGGLLTLSFLPESPFRVASTVLEVPVLVASTVLEVPFAVIDMCGPQTFLG